MSRSYSSRTFRTTTNRGSSPAPHEQMFTCVRCHLPISCAPEVAGVQNRNHCPACLCSRHMDWRAPGDRRSNCRAPMEPIGLTTKRSRNKYARERDGELMLIHRCVGCGKIVINRVAADDSAEELIALLEDSQTLDPSLIATLEADDVLMLSPADHALVRTRLFGAGRDELRSHPECPTVVSWGYDAQVCYSLHDTTK